MAHTSTYHWLQLGLSYFSRQWRYHWLRTGLSILGIALGVAVLLAIQLANQTTLQRFKENVSLVAGQTKTSLVPVADETLDESILNRLSPLWDIGATFAPVIEGRAVMLPNGNETDSSDSTNSDSSGALAGIPLQVLGVDMASDYVFRPLQFTEPPVMQNAIFQHNRVYIPEKLATQLGLTIGDSWQILMQDNIVTLTVAGITTNQGPALAYGGQVILMDIANAQLLLRQIGRIHRVDVTWPDGISQQNATQLITLPDSAEWITPSMQQQQTVGMVKAFQSNLTALSLIALLVAGFLIYNTISLAMLRRRMDIATLRTLGANSGQLIVWFLAELSLLGILGSGLGILLGIVLATQAVDAVSSTVGVLYTGMPVSGVILSWSTLLLAFSFGVLVTLGSGLIPVLLTLIQSPARALRRWSETQEHSTVPYAIASITAFTASVWASQQPPVEGFPLFGHASSFLLVLATSLGIPVLLALLLNMAKWVWQCVFSLPVLNHRLAAVANLLPVILHQLRALRGRTSVAIASLMVALSMAVSLTIMIHSFRQTVESWVSQSITADLWIEAEGYNVGTKRLLDPDIEARIKRLPDVAAVDAFLERPFQLNGESTRLAVGDFNVFRTYGNLHFLSGEASKSVFIRALKTGGVVVTEPFASRFNVTDGDSIRIPTSHGHTTLTIEGVYHDYASEQGYMVMDRGVYQRHFNNGNATSGLAIYGKQNTDIDALRTRILKTLPSQTRLSILTRQALRNEIFRIFDNTFAITYALHAIAITVALLGMLITLLALVMATRREFGILSWLGVTPRQLGLLVVLQGTTLCLLGTLLGGAVGIGLSQFLVNVINKQSFGWSVDYAIPATTLIGLLSTMLMAGIAISFIPAKLAAKPLSPQALREEN